VAEAVALMEPLELLQVVAVMEQQEPMVQMALQIRVAVLVVLVVQAEPEVQAALALSLSKYLTT